MLQEVLRQDPEIIHQQTYPKRSAALHLLNAALTFNTTHKYNIINYHNSKKIDMKKNNQIIRIFSLLFVVITASALSTKAQNVVWDFEDYNIGDTFKMWNLFGSEASTSSAVVEADPKNPNNKVLHVIVKEWNTFVEFTLPESLAGHKLTDNVKSVRLNFYRPSSDADHWKQFHVFLGSERLFQDEGYPHQGDQGQWQSREYKFNPVAESADDERMFRLGIHHENSEYYIDNITLEQYIVADGQTLDYCTKNTSSNYTVINAPLSVGEGKELSIKTSRYTYWNSRVVGSGTINLFSGGERTFLGNSDKSYPDWSGYTGSLHVYPYKEVESGCGFYGLVWMHNGKTFIADDPIQSANEGKVNNCLANAALYLHDGSTLAAEQGINGMRIGKLETEPGSILTSYYKSKDGKNAYYLVGNGNHDATLAGRIAPCEDNMKMKVGIIKEGTGTYTITGNDNLITGGITVMEGTMLINNDAKEAESQKKTGATGYHSGDNNGVVVRTAGTLGGNGSVGLPTEVFGTIAPGDNGTGTLNIADYAKDTQPTLTLRPKSRLVMEIASVNDHDELNITGKISYNNTDELFNVSDKMPRIVLSLADNTSLAKGDEIVLLSAAGKETRDGKDWNFDIIYPKAYTWKVEQRISDDGSLKVVAIVTDEKYSGQGDDTIDDGDEDKPQEETKLDIEKEKTDDTPLRTYAEKINKYIGTCVPVWYLNVDNDNDKETKLIADQFNMVVCENEMKFAYTEPQQGKFDYYHGDRLVNFAERHNMRIRGHALVWHSQVAEWLSSDGIKNNKNWTREQLLGIMKTHIENVVGHWKGKIHEWDVCNEVLDDDQGVVWTNPEGYNLRQSVWTVIGEDFLDSAFVWAHRADPNAVLILNDYGVEFKGDAKSEALFNLAKRLKARNVPIDGVGLQSHLGVYCVDAARLEANIRRYNAIGLKCVITELDLGMNDTEEWTLNQQAQDYYNIAQIAMKYDNCNELMIWGLNDSRTWRTGSHPLLYDENNVVKPAYYGVHAAIRQASGSEIGDQPIDDGIDDTQITDKPISVAYYSLQGVPVGTSYRGPVVKVSLYKNGQKRIRKTFR